MKKLFILLFSLSLLLIAPSTFAQTGSGCCDIYYQTDGNTFHSCELSISENNCRDQSELLQDQLGMGTIVNHSYYQSDNPQYVYSCDDNYQCITVDTGVGAQAGAEGDETDGEAPVLGTTNQKPASGSSNTPSVAQAVSLRNPIAADTPQELIGSIINYVLGIIGPLALLMFVVGGLTWMTSAGNPDRIKKGQSILIWSAIGLVVVLFAYGLVRVLFELAAK